MIYSLRDIIPGAASLIVSLSLLYICKQAGRGRHHSQTAADALNKSILSPSPVIVFNISNYRHWTERKCLVINNWRNLVASLLTITIRRIDCLQTWRERGLVKDSWANCNDRRYLDYFARTAQGYHFDHTAERRFYHQSETFISLSVCYIVIV